MTQFADMETNRKYLNQLNGPETLVLVLKQNQRSELKEEHNIALLKAVAEAIWKLCYSGEACDRFRRLGVVGLFISHLNQPTEDVSTSISLLYHQLTGGCGDGSRFCCR